MGFLCCDFAEWVWKVSGTEGEQKSSSPNSIWGGVGLRESKN